MRGSDRCTVRSSTSGLVRSCSACWIRSSTAASDALEPSTARRILMAAILRGSGLGRFAARGEAHGEGAALADLALEGDRAAVLLDDLLRAGEADAGAGDAALDVTAALEALEDARLVGAGDADAAVLH